MSTPTTASPNTSTSHGTILSVNLYPRAWVLFRVFITTYTAATIIWSMLFNLVPFAPQRPLCEPITCIKFWFIYLTHWSMLLTFCYFCIELFLTYKMSKTNTLSDRCEIATRYTKYSTLGYYLFIISLPTSTIVTSMYWVLVHDGFENLHRAIESCHAHGVLTLLLLMDYIANNIQVSTDRQVGSSVVATFLFGLFYACFTIIFWLAGGTDADGNEYIYEVLDYGEDMKSSLLYLSFVLTANVTFDLALVSLKNKVIRPCLSGACTRATSDASVAERAERAKKAEIVVAHAAKAECEDKSENSDVNLVDSKKQLQGLQQSAISVGSGDIQVMTLPVEENQQSPHDSEIVIKRNASTQV